MRRSVELYSDNASGAARKIWAEIENGILRIDLQDLGPACVPFCGDDEYEYCLMDIDAQKVKDIIGVATDEDLLNWLKVNYNTASAAYDFNEFLNRNNITHSFYSG